jgi:Tol biopolymer transport system component
MSGRVPPRVACAALAVALLGALALPAAAARDDLDLISRAAGPTGAGADGDSFLPSLSGDGRFVAFTSAGDNLVPEDDKAVRDVFLRDTLTGAVTLISRATGPAGAPTTGDSNDGSVSRDGRFVAFSTAGALTAEDTNNDEDIYLRNTVTGTTALVSRANTVGVVPGPVGDHGSFLPAISADGRRVAFPSVATNLADDGTATEDIFVRDTATGSTDLVSRATGPAGAPGDAGSFGPAVITADGRYVAFESVAKNLSPDDNKGVDDIFVRDVLASTTTLVSRATGAVGAAGDGLSGDASISADGRYVAFDSEADNLSTEDDKAAVDVFVRDMVNNTTTLVSRATGAAGAPGNADSNFPFISPDGRYVAFQSDANNLSTEDNDAAGNVSVRDLQSGTTTLVSRAAGAAGAGGDGTSFSGPISADDRYVAFSSDADNLSTDDANAFENVFRRDLSAAPAIAATPSGGAPPIRPHPPTALCAGVRATIVGTNARNVIRGTPKRDVIAALGGNDLVRGLGGGDLICLGAGNDRGIGGAGADHILGQAGTDREEGGPGADLLEGGAGRDLLLGGAGIDRLIGLAGRDRAVGGPGRDVCRVELRSAC